MPLNATLQGNILHQICQSFPIELHMLERRIKDRIKKMYNLLLFYKIVLSIKAKELLHIFDEIAENLKILSVIIPIKQQLRYAQNSWNYTTFINPNV